MTARAGAREHPAAAGHHAHRPRSAVLHLDTLSAGPARALHRSPLRAPCGSPARRQHQSGPQRLPINQVATRTPNRRGPCVARSRGRRRARFGRSSVLQRHPDGTCRQVRLGCTGRTEKRKRLVAGHQRYRCGVSTRVRLVCSGSSAPRRRPFLRGRVSGPHADVDGGPRRRHAALRRARLVRGRRHGLGDLRAVGGRHRPADLPADRRRSGRAGWCRIQLRGARPGHRRHDRRAPPRRR